LRRQPTAHSSVGSGTDGFSGGRRRPGTGRSGRIRTRLSVLLWRRRAGWVARTGGSGLREFNCHADGRRLLARRRQEGLPRSFGQGVQRLQPKLWRDENELGAQRLAQHGALAWRGLGSPRRAADRRPWRCRAPEKKTRRGARLQSCHEETRRLLCRAVWRLFRRVPATGTGGLFAVLSRAASLLLPRRRIRSLVTNGRR
jgi:hypothetical protein